MKFNKIISAIALMTAVAFAACDTPDIPGPGPTPNPNPNPEVTSDTLTVAQAIAKQDNSEAYVKGYIVGWYSNHNNDKQVIFSAEATADTTVSATNVVIADAADVVDATVCAYVQLPAGALRVAINLKDNPKNLAAPIVVHGALTKYNGMAGIKTIDQAWINGKAITGIPDDVTEITVAEALEKASALEAGASSSEYYMVKGIVSAVATAKDNLLQYGNINFTLQDATGAIGCYYINYLNNVKFDSEDQILNVGDSVVVISQLKNYEKNGNTTPELANGYLQSITKGNAESEIIDVTFADAVAIANKLNADASTLEVYRVSGVISVVTTKEADFVTKYSNCNFKIYDGTNKDVTITCYFTNYLNNQAFTSKDQMPKAEQKVTVVGQLMNYKGNTPEIYKGYIESIQ